MQGSDGVIEANKGALAGNDIAWCDRCRIQCREDAWGCEGS